MHSLMKASTSYNHIPFSALYPTLYKTLHSTLRDSLGHHLLVTFSNHLLHSLRRASPTRRSASVRLQVIRPVQYLPVILLHGVQGTRSRGTFTRTLVSHSETLKRSYYKNQWWGWTASPRCIYVASHKVLLLDNSRSVGHFRLPHSESECAIDHDHTRSLVPSPPLPLTKWRPFC